MSKVIAIIPARGGSKRVKKKNLYPLLGKPLIAYAIDVAKFSGIFNEIYVNSEDEEILNIAQKYGAAPYKRPLELATDKTFLIEVIKVMINKLQLHSCTIGILLPTAPLRTKEDILNAYKIF